MDNNSLERPGRAAYARRIVEERFGPIRSGLLERLRAGKTRHQIAAEWDVHVNTIHSWIAEEQIERHVVYAVRDEPAGARM